ncbi:MAG: PhoU domain-containing protein [Thermoproteota archaeon]|nr:PhoU domain-containing protein [Thermoproteota archaeon]
MSEIRSVQLSGKSTFIVSLPKHWIKSNNIKVHDKLVILENEDGSLTIYPYNKFKRKDESIITVDFKTYNSYKEVLRECIALYLAGYQSIKIINITSNLHELKEELRERLVGIEIIDETINSFTIHVFTSSIEVNIGKILERMFSIVYLMFENFISLVKGEVDYYKRIIELDTDVDRFYNFISRQINQALSNSYLVYELGLNNKLECIEYKLVARALERIADHIEEMVSNFIKLSSVCEEIKKDIVNLSEKIKENFKDMLITFLKKNKEKANKNITNIIEILNDIRNLTENLLKNYANKQELTSLKLILESLKRISEYTIDIAEHTINIANYNY